MALPPGRFGIPTSDLHDVRLMGVITLLGYETLAQNGVQRLVAMCSQVALNHITTRTTHTYRVS